eukprot:CAMPEP_0119322334 /NCGR_PEP_ID=MMETSP1333-20130426/57876_1 /TAXON_ID=418940 /ORGANISM="Scyphosphaera apsteinii, Strain RCC1455" /LENGTH=394 /DNA_ID=CAMNT_0007329533 /DNA_START=10 /DNA_END=1195 /DNA_ORIENTATION=+
MSADAELSVLELVAWVVLIFLLLRILSKLEEIYLLLNPSAPASPKLIAIPSLLLRKGLLVLWSAVYLVFSKDKVTKRQINRTADPDDIKDQIHRQVRVIFVRHGESMWNLVFNRGFGPSFIVRFAQVVLYELYVVPLNDSAFMDSPLSQHGIRQCAQLQDFLRKPWTDPDPASRADFEAIVRGEGHSLLVSSQLRRAVSTLAIAISDRLARTNESIVLHSACQEISRNFDTQSLAPTHTAPRVSGTAELEASLTFEPSFNEGNKGLSLTGHKRLHKFAQWVCKQDFQTVIVAGHSLWFRTFFQVYLPKSFDHVCKRHKIVNCGVVGFTLQSGTSAEGDDRHRIDPDSLRVIMGASRPNEAAAQHGSQMSRMSARWQRAMQCGSILAAASATPAM